MSSAIRRRDLLLGIGGGVAGLALTPVPWKLLDDVSIWTQHRPSLPIPPRGEVTYRSTACTLCPAGCALRVRCVGARPVSIAGEREHPLGGGACAVGLTIHHLPYHPLRLAGPERLASHGRREATTREALVAAVAAAVAQAKVSGRSVAVLDQRPGRAISCAYREWLAALPGGLYVTTSGEEATLELLQAAAGISSPLGLDLEAAKTLVSFGAPLLDGWGRPGRLQSIRDRLRIIQIDAWRSPSAERADEWVPVRPGSEGGVALGLLRELLRAGLAPRQGVTLSEPFTRQIEDWTPERVAAVAGLEPGRLIGLARALADGRPSLAIGGGDAAAGPLGLEAERAIVALNIVLGALGGPGGGVVRRGLPDASGVDVGRAAVDLATVPDGSLGVLILDSADSGRAFPWRLAQRKLAPGALVVSLSPFRTSLASHAVWQLPSPAPLESHDEVLPTPDASVASYGIAAPILAPSPQMTEPLAFISLVAQGTGVALASPASMEELLKRRVAALHARGGGRLFVRGEAGFVEAPAGTAGDVWRALVEGGCWVDGRSPAAAWRHSELAAPAHPLPAAEAARGKDELVLIATGTRGVVGGAPVSPLLSKLYQESDLQPRLGAAIVHPGTAARLGLEDRCRVHVEGAAGAQMATLVLDPAAPIDTVGMAFGPSARALHPSPGKGSDEASAICAPADDGTWRAMRVRVREA